MRAAFVGLLIALALLLGSAPAQAMTVNCYPTAVARMWVTKCVVIHDDGTREYFLVLP